MATATPTPTSGAYQRLQECLLRLSRGPWKFIQLRGGPLDASAIDGDDVDLLGSRDAVTLLLHAAFRWVQAGDCHLQIQATTPAKTAVSLFSTDGNHRVDFDLWVELWQLNERRRCLRYELCAPQVIDPGAALQRLPLELEAVIYVQHLISKRKDLRAAKVGQRLGDYAAACRAAKHAKLAEVLTEITTTAQISSAAQHFVEQLVLERLAVPEPQPYRRRLQKIGDAWRTAGLAAPRRTSIITIMGCDGSGKTTLAQQLAARRPGIAGVLTGKHLYRKSWFYKLLVIFIRPLLFQDRERFDETFAPVAYLRACLGLRLKLWRRSRGVLLMDRSLADFLFVGRKTDQPKFCRSRWLMRIMGRRIPTVHLIVPYDRIQTRKLEMTQSGHEIYDAAMFAHFASLAPVDYYAFNNQGELEESVAALDRVLASRLPKRQG